MKLNKELRKLMVERFGKDTVIALATINQEYYFLMEQFTILSFKKTL